PASAEIYTLSLHDALPIWAGDHVEAEVALVDHAAADIARRRGLELVPGHLDRLVAATETFLGEQRQAAEVVVGRNHLAFGVVERSEEHTSELQSRSDLVCR